MSLTRQEHIERHKNLHRSLDELLADWITNSGLERPYPTEHTISELIEWSCQQTINPVPDRYDSEEQSETVGVVESLGEITRRNS